MIGWRFAGLAALSGAAGALGHAPFSWWPVALFGFAGLIWSVAHAERAFLTAWAGGAGYFAVALHWIVEPFLVETDVHGWMAPFALILMAGGLALFWGAAGWLSARIGGNRALTFAFAVALAEMARGHVLTGFPWALPAYIWTNTPIRMTAAVWGPYGLTTFTLLIAALATLGRDWGKRIVAMTGAALLLVALAAQGMLRDGRDYRTDGARVALVQPNAPQDEKWDPEKAHVFVRRLIELTADVASEDIPPVLIVWPETAIPYPLDVAAPVLSEAAGAADGVPFITGLNRRTDDGEWFNSLIVVGSDGLVDETYDKVHLVPFGEYIPGRIDLLRRMAAFTGFGFTPGDAVRVIDTPLGKAVPLICYEAIFPGHVRRAGERPDYLLQITNDAWFGTFAGPQQHLQQAQFRAAEQGLPLIRVANTGISATIDASGEVRTRIPLGVADAVTAHMLMTLPPTIYSKLGDLPVAIALIVLLAALSLTGRRNSIAPGRNPQ